MWIYTTGVALESMVHEACFDGKMPLPVNEGLYWIIKTKGYISQILGDSIGNIKTKDGKVLPFWIHRGY